MTDEIKRMDEFLPTYRGRCVNTRCSGTNNQRVLSVMELRRVYPATSRTPYTPLPSTATHVCDRCGMVYSGFETSFSSSSMETASDERIDVSEIEWDRNRIHETDVYTAALELVEACPEDADTDMVVDVVRREIVGFGESEAEDVIEDSDTEFTVYPISDFM